MKTALERFEEKFTKTVEGCWLWTAHKNTEGYGRFLYNGSKGYAHRFSYESYVGEIPYHNSAHGMCVLHKCDIPACVNPDHLFLGTNADNVADRMRKGRNGFISMEGSKNGNAKLTESDIPIIRQRLANGETQKKIASDYNVSGTLISMIHRGLIWKGGSK